jgi:hypothetical protein
MPVKGLSNSFGGNVMIVKKQVKTQASNNAGRPPFWLTGLEQPSVPVTERAMAVFQPDILVDAQFQSTYRRRFYLDPERVLMLAVLQDAVVCFQENLTATCKRKQVMHVEAEEWILNKDKSYLFSFENVCEMLGYDAGYMREGLLRWKRAALANRNERRGRRTMSRLGTGLRNNMGAMSPGRMSDLRAHALKTGDRSRQ